MPAELSDIVRRIWGYDTLRPFQSNAMARIVAGRDSLVVLPTGGGKSLCYQAPALAMEGMALVVSPLISLMKDQVDSLRAVGVGAACINSSLTARERRETHEAIQLGDVKLLYVAPERVVKPEFIAYLKKLQLSFFAIDEAHCISQWGHDFRPEYRALETLRDAFPDLAFHAYTATATPQVREDICGALKLHEPEVLVASADRPNLVYSAERRAGEFRQVLEVVERHKGESGVIYCITRKKVEELASQLTAAGHPALPYHAGMGPEERQKHQEAFSREGAEIIVATVAFGMGIDKPDVRYVIHTGMPKTIEHYQQESGRAGRDGLEAECVLIYGGNDFNLWNILLGDLDAAALKIARGKLNDMFNYCTTFACRHKVLLDYFGEKLEKKNCGACDTCLGNLDTVKDALVIAQKILSCVVRLGPVAGPSYTTLILQGSREARVVDKGHDQLSTFGLLAEHDSRAVRDWIEQLVAQGYLEKTGEYNILEITAAGREVLRGEVTPRLLKPSAGARIPRKGSAAEAKSWAGVDRKLFAALRELRREIALEQQRPAFAVFGDAALRDMARKKPATEAAFIRVHGVGEKKCADYAARFLPVIQEYVGEKKPEEDTNGNSQVRDARKSKAFELFEQGWGIEEVAGHVHKPAAQVCKYLREYVRENRITDPTQWIDPGTADDISIAAEAAEGQSAREVFLRLNQEVDMGLIHVVLACMENEGVTK